MTIGEIVRLPRSREVTQLVVETIATDPNQFDQLLSLYLGPDTRTTQNVAYYFMHVTDHQPELLSPHLDKLIEQLFDKPNVAIKRNTLRFLQNLIVPEKYEGEMVEYCFNILLENKEPIAIKVFAMTVLANLTQRYPDLKNELSIVIRDLMENGSPGILSRGKKTLRILEKL